MKKRLLPMAVAVAAFAGMFSAQGQQMSTPSQQYSERQALIQSNEVEVDRYIQQRMNDQLPALLTEKFKHEIEEHEDAASFSELEKQQQFEELKQQYWRQNYFYENPSTTGMYNSIVAGSCANGDFEGGNFMNYTGESAIGSVNGYRLGDCAILTADPTYQSDPIIFTPDDPNTAIANNFSITNVGNDPIVTTGTLPMVWAGNHSAKINAAVNGFGVNKLIKRVVLSEANEEIFFNYALVLQDPGSGHDGQKPTFVATCIGCER